MSKDYNTNVTVNGDTVSVTVTGIGNYTGTYSTSYTKKKIALTPDDITLSSSLFTYDGKAKNPGVTVKSGGTTLKSGTDYTLSYEKNINAGEAYAVVTGKGSYTGMERKAFTISPRGLSVDAVSVSSAAQVYDGSEKKPAASVSFNGLPLTAGTDFRVVYTNNINAGEAFATVTGMGNYSGTVNKPFTISPLNVSALTVSVENSDLVYNGYKQSPTVNVYYGNKSLSKGYDYSLSESRAVNVGNASLTLTGLRNFTGTRSVNFRIVANSIKKAEIIPEVANVTYDGEAKCPGVSVRLNGVYLKDADYTVSYSANKNAGTASITVKGKGNYTDSAAGTFVIDPKSIKGAIVKLPEPSYVYDGKEKKPNPTVELDGKTLVKNDDYTVSYENNITSGTAKVKIKGIGNYKDSVNATFDIVLDRQPFQWGKDNLNFNNDGKASFGVQYDSNDKAITTHRDLIGSTYLNALKSNITEKEYGYLTGNRDAVITMELDGKRYYYDDYLNAKWGGSCYGMSVVNLLGHYGYFPFSQYTNGASGVYDFDKPKDNSKVRGLIEYYHLSQRTEGHLQRGYRNKNGGTKESNINKIISELNKYEMVLVCYGMSGWGGHAVIAYDNVEHFQTGNGNDYVTINNHRYNHYIETCDPNASEGLSPNTATYIFYDDEYNWAIHGYGLTSDYGAYFSDITGDPELINYGGYHKKPASYDYSYIARMNVYEMSEERSVSKCDIINGNYIGVNKAEEIKDIVEGEEADYSGEGEATEGYYMSDAEVGYRVTQPKSQELSLTMDYENTYLKAYSESAESAVFNHNGYVAVSGDNAAAYQLSITANENYPTVWSALTVSGVASDATFTMTDEGYVLTADNLNNIIVYANNKYITAHTAFSSSAKSVLIYEIDSNTIGIKADNDNNGTFETAVSSNIKSLGNCKLSLSENKMTYNGSACEPQTIVNDGDFSLIKGKDYTVVYENENGKGKADIKVIGINGYSGTLSASYYIEDDIPLGDVDNSGVVSAADRAKITRYVAKWKNSEIDFDTEAADVNLDGKIDALDRIIITRHVAKCSGYSSLPVA